MNVRIVKLTVIAAVLLFIGMNLAGCSFLSNMEDVDPLSKLPRLTDTTGNVANQNMITIVLAIAVACGLIYGVIDFKKKILDCVIGRNSLCGVLVIRLRGFLPLALPKSFS